MPVLLPFQVADRIKSFKKPKSKIKGDIFPSMATAMSDILALPLTDIYNTITTTLQWPDVWKLEIVTVIPKKSDATNFDDLRNISCALLVSKIYESFFLSWIREEVVLKHNQFGGERG